MKMWKRIFTSIKRRKNQTIITFLVVFILGNVLFASIAVKQSAKNVEDQLRLRVPSTISITENEDTYVDSAYTKGLFHAIDAIEKDEDVKQVIRFTSLTNCYTNLFVSDFQTLVDGMDITKGRNYTQDDLESDTFKVVMTDEGNYYKVGDTFDFALHVYADVNENGEWVEEDLIIQFEIIGFTSGYLYEKNGISVENYSLFIMPECYQKRILEIQENYYMDHGGYLDFQLSPRVENIVIETHGMDSIDQVANKIRKDDNYHGSLFVMQTSNDDYRYVQAPLENLKALADVTLWACVVLVIVILSLVSILFIRNSKQEIGILMSLGEKKSKLIGQFVFEIILVGLLASTISMMSGNRLGNVISNEFMKIQIDTEAELEYQEDHAGAMTQLDMLEAYEIKLNSEYIVTIYLVSFAILFISAAAPMVVILKTDPKKVMLP